MSWSSPDIDPPDRRDSGPDRRQAMKFTAHNGRNTFGRPDDGHGECGAKDFSPHRSNHHETILPHEGAKDFSPLRSDHRSTSSPGTGGFLHLLLCFDKVKYTFISADCGRQPQTDPPNERNTAKSSFPNLVHAEWSITAEATNVYNCIAWSAGIEEPDAFIEYVRICEGSRRVTASVYSTTVWR